MTDTSKRNEEIVDGIYDECGKGIKPVRRVLLEALATKDAQRDESVREAVSTLSRKANEQLSNLVSALHEQLCFTGLATEQQWNESIAPHAKRLANVLSGCLPDSPTARVYKFPRTTPQDQTPNTTQEELSVALEKIQWSIKGECPNRFIYDHKNRRTAWRVKDSEIELSGAPEHTCCVYTFKGSKVEVLNTADAVSFGTEECFILFMNHTLERRSLTTPQEAPQEGLQDKK